MSGVHGVTEESVNPANAVLLHTGIATWVGITNKTPDANQHYLQWHRNFDNIYYVSQNGNDATGIKGSEAFPYATPDAAIAAASSGDFVVFKAGTYTATSGIYKDGVSLGTIGVVTINKTTNGHLFDFTTATQNVYIIGSFILNKSGTGNIFYLGSVTAGLSYDISIISGTSEGMCIGGYNGTLPSSIFNLSGHLTSTTNQVSLLQPTSAIVNLQGILQSDTTSGIICGGSNNRFNISSTVISTSTALTVQADTSVVIASGTINGDVLVQDGFTVINGQVIGNVTNNATPEVNFVNGLYTRGNITGNFINDDESASTIDCNIGGSIMVVSGIVTVISGNTKKTTQDFDVTGGVLIIKADWYRNEAFAMAASNIDGGEVILMNNIYLSDKPILYPYLVNLVSGKLTLKCNAFFTGTTPADDFLLPSLVNQSGGTIYFDSCKFYASDAGTTPITCDAGQDVAILQSGLSTNVNIFTSRKLTTFVTVTAAVDGQTYDYGTASYVAGPADTVITIATALVAALALDPDVVATDNGDGTFDCIAAVAGTPFANNTTGPIAQQILQQNHTAPTDIITGTAQNTRYLVDALVG